MDVFVNSLIIEPRLQLRYSYKNAFDKGISSPKRYVRTTG